MQTTFDLHGAGLLCSTDDSPSKPCTLQVMKAHLVHRMAKLSELVDPGSGLHIGVVARPDGTHASGLVPSVALSAVLKV